FREARTRKYLQQMDPRLDLFWVWTAVHEDDVNEEIIHWEGRYALIYYLHQDDPLRILQTASGQDKAWDILGWFCVDMNKANSDMLPCDEMEPKVVKFLGLMDGEQHDVMERLKESFERNTRHTASMQRDYVDTAVQRALENRRIHMDIPFVGRYTTRRG
ncbi:hypothetical protein LCGC14_2759280, partial [marine sediment metagenome]